VLNPYEQARKQAQLLAELTMRRGGLEKLQVRALVALPLIPREAWDERFGHLLIETPILCGDEQTPARLRAAVERAAPVRYGEPLDDYQTTGTKPDRLQEPKASLGIPGPACPRFKPSAAHPHNSSRPFPKIESGPCPPGMAARS